ncbi:NAD-dependent epimerase [Actinoplanes sp. ATCC 53533]|uniref:NAD-dependent epimerase n=1 Tax=Actinoplanes sp. ATCC 53533 TaxID=1288362 RepID=UPI000F7B5F2D|nr:NAD-dependent epimerase [Actinoplanes sp. ATCC 53533]RSM64541.1 NAD-dependent epimerase [Actinoplanes sp. ATCC 53533]
MSLHVIVGASGVGVATARLLADRGEQVKIVTRSGSGPEHPAIERIAADATDGKRLTAITEGAAALYNAANPRYDRWLTDWPPLASALMTAAERTGAVLASAATLYGYGLVTGPMSETTPLTATHPKLRLRAQMWRDALAAHRAGRIRATEVRSSDFVQGTGAFGLMVAKPVLAGKRTVVTFAPDQPHSFTSVNDAAAALIAVAADPRAWGRAWHAPTNAPLTLRQLAARFAEVAGAPAPKLTAVPYAALWTAGVFVPIVRELRTTRYQWDRPFIMDSAATEETFDLKPQPLDDALREVARDLQR